MRRVEAVTAWTFTSLGVALLGLSILVVPSRAFGYTSECTPCPGSIDPVGCSIKCCQTNCGNPTCMDQCCKDACGGDTDCYQNCQAGKQVCVPRSVKCEPSMVRPRCVANAAGDCYKDGDKTVDAAGNPYTITDPCNVKGNPQACAACECRQVVVNGMKMGCACEQKAP